VIGKEIPEDTVVVITTEHGNHGGVQTRVATQVLIHHQLVQWDGYVITWVGILDAMARALQSLGSPGGGIAYKLTLQKIQHHISRR